MSLLSSICIVRQKIGHKRDYTIYSVKFVAVCNKGMKFMLKSNISSSRPCGRPFFTVVTVCLNTPNLEKTCNSVIKQNFNAYEWIVIDGGSGPETMKLWDAYKAQLHYFVSEPDGGIYAAMNKGIAQARGEYLIFMNGGDWFANRHILELAYEKLAANPTIDVLYGETNTPFDGYNNLSHTPSEERIEETLFVGNLRHQASFIRRQCFEMYGGYDVNHKISSDWKYFATLHLHRATFLRWNCIVANCSPFGISWNKRECMLDHKRAMDEVYSRAEQAVLRKKYVFDKLRAAKVHKL